MIIIRILLIIVRRRRRRRRAVAPTSNTASHSYHEKMSWRVSIGMGLRLAALRAAGAPLLRMGDFLSGNSEREVVFHSRNKWRPFVIYLKASAVKTVMSTILP